MPSTLGVDNVRWDFGPFYQDIDDPQIDADIASVTEKAKVFAESYRGNLAATLEAAIHDYAEIDMMANKIMAFLALRQSVDLTNAQIKARLSQVERELTMVHGEYVTFFELELVALPDSVLATLYQQDQAVARYRPWVEHARIFKPHVLSEEVESALVKRSQFGSHAWAEFFDEVETDLTFPFRNEQKTLTELLHILTTSMDAGERAEALKIINDGFRGYFAKYSAQTLYVVAGLKSVEDKERSYKNPMDGQNKSNRIPDEVVNILHDVVRDVAAPLAQRYYRLKAKHLGLDRLKWSDRNAPMPFADAAEINFDEAKKIVGEAYQTFSPTLAGIVQTFYDQGRVDAPALKGKQSGAFNYSIVLPGGKPVSYTLLNYLGSNNDVMTLAHELGHGVHGMLAGEAQGPLMFHAPIAYCETASVFGEMTTFHFLNQRLQQEKNDTTRLALIMGKLDSIINTVVRQIGFSNFERRLHGMDASYTQWREPKKLSDEELCSIWMTTVQELYGPDGDVFTYENMEYQWSYVSHFHRPFYVYGYAFGELLTQGLYAERQRLGSTFEPLYLDLLRSGSTRTVDELLKPFGLNPRTREFWIRGISVSLETLIKEAEDLTQRLKV